MDKDNKTVYMEAVAKPEDCPKPDAQNFAKTASIAETLNAACPLENVFRHLVPPVVRQQQDELQKILQGIVSKEFQNIQTANEQLQAFLKQLGLPQSLHSLTAA